MPECDGVAGYWLGHKMRPRYHTYREAPEWFSDFIKRASGQIRSDFPEQDTKVIWTCDVCERCGHITRPGLNEEL